jgi:hypothetical protein
LTAALGGGVIGGVVGSVYNPADGSVRTTYDDGSTVTTSPNGSVTSTPATDGTPAPVIDRSTPYTPSETPVTTTPVSDTGGPQLVGGPVDQPIIGGPVNPTAPFNLVSQGFSDSAPGTVYDGPDGKTVVLNSGKVVSLADYQAALASGQPVSIDNMMDAGYKVDLKGMAVPEPVPTPAGNSSGYDQKYVDLVDNYQANPTPANAQALDSYLASLGNSMNHTMFMTNAEIAAQNAATGTGGPVRIDVTGTGTGTGGGTGTGEIVTSTSGPVTVTYPVTPDTTTIGGLLGTGTPDPTSSTTALFGPGSTPGINDLIKSEYGIIGMGRGTVTNLPNGSVIELWPDGTALTVNPDHSSTLNKNDGTTISKDPTGATVTPAASTATPSTVTTTDNVTTITDTNGTVTKVSDLISCPGLKESSTSQYKLTLDGEYAPCRATPKCSHPLESYCWEGMASA